MRPECKWYRNGWCRHMGRPRRCNPSDEEWFNFSQKLHPIWCDQVCELQTKESRFFTLTLEDLEALREGKVLYCLKDTIFIALKGEDDGRDPNGL